MQQDREISQLQATCQSSINLPADTPPTEAKLQLGVHAGVCASVSGGLEGRRTKERRADQRSGEIELEIFHGSLA